MTGDTRVPMTVGEILAEPHVVGGNTAKLRVMIELQKRMARHNSLRILDVGCVGLQPLQFWMQLLERYQFHLTGIDVSGIDRARSLVLQRGWESKVTLIEGSGYNLTTLVAAGSFEIVVATQVLEHIAHLTKFLRQVAAVLCQDGEAFFTIDSAHWRRRFEWRQPIRAMKDVVKKALSLVGNERHYDLPLFDSEIIAACGEVGLTVRTCRYYNMAPLKWLHNRLLADEVKNRFLQQWFHLEEFMNDVHPGARRAREYFAGLYVHAYKSWG